MNAIIIKAKYLFENSKAFDETDNAEIYCDTASVVVLENSRLINIINLKLSRIFEILQRSLFS